MRKQKGRVSVYTQFTSLIEVTLMSEFVMSILSHSQINKGLFIVKKLEIIFAG